MTVTTKVFDYDGNEVPWAWLEQNFGKDVCIERATVTDGKPVTRIVEVRARKGYASLVAVVRDQDGQNIPDFPVVRCAPPFDPLPPWNEPPERWGQDANGRLLGIGGKTKVDGTIGFDMGNGDYYFPGQTIGASWIFTASPNTHSDCIFGLGMLGGTNHYHLDTVFELVPETDEPDPPVPPDGDMTAFEVAMLALFRIEMNALEAQLIALYELLQRHFEHTGGI